MPMHDFKCLECGKEFQFYKLRSDEKVQDDGCPHCGNKDVDKLEKQFPRSGSFELKGKGWYGDGYE